MGVLLILMTIGGLIVAAILFVISIWKKMDWLKKFVLGGVVVWLVFYAAMLFGFSLLSEEKVFALNEPKEYCGFYLDCHLHTSILEVRTAKQIGNQTAQGIFYIVKVKVSSDAKNPEIPFHLTEPKAEIYDNGGRIYTRSAKAENQLPTARVKLNQDIKGAETIEKEIVFDITEPTDKLRFLITEGYGVDKYIEAVLVDDEDSIFHRKTFFGIEINPQTASAN